MYIMGGGKFDMLPEGSKYPFVDFVLNDINEKFKDRKFSLSDLEKKNLEEMIKAFAEYLYTINFANELTDNSEPIKPKSELDKVLNILGTRLDDLIPNFKRSPVINFKILTPAEQEEKEQEKQIGEYKQAIKSVYANGVMLAVGLYLQEQYENSQYLQITSQHINASVRTYEAILKNNIANNYSRKECGSDGSCAIHSYIAALRNYAATLPQCEARESVNRKLLAWNVQLSRKEDASNTNPRKELTDDEIELFRKRLVNLLKAVIATEVLNCDEPTLKVKYLTDVRNDINQQHPEELNNFDTYYASMLKKVTYLRDQELYVIARQDQININVIKDDGRIILISPAQNSSIGVTLRNHGVSHFTAYIKNIPSENKETQHKASALYDANMMARNEADIEAEQNIAWVNEYIASQAPKSLITRFIEFIFATFKLIASAMGFKSSHSPTGDAIAVQDNFSYQDILDDKILNQSIDLQKLVAQLCGYCTKRYDDKNISSEDKAALKQWWLDIKSLLKEQNFNGFFEKIEKLMDQNYSDKPQVQPQESTNSDKIQQVLRFSSDNALNIKTEILDNRSKDLMKRYNTVLNYKNSNLT